MFSIFRAACDRPFFIFASLCSGKAGGERATVRPGDWAPSRLSAHRHHYYHSLHPGTWLGVERRGGGGGKGGGVLRDLQGPVLVPTLLLWFMSRTCLGNHQKYCWCCLFLAFSRQLYNLCSFVRRGGGGGPRNIYPGLLIRITIHVIFGSWILIRRQWEAGSGSALKFKIKNL